MSLLSSQSRLFILRTVLRNTSLRPINPNPSQVARRSVSSSPIQCTSSSTLPNPTTRAPTSNSNPKSDPSAESDTNRISRTTLHRLHVLSSLNPPAPNSSEEEELIGELSELINLMDQVKDVTLPSNLEERSKLLYESLGGMEVLVSQDSLDELDAKRSKIVEDGKKTEGEVDAEMNREKHGKELLSWSTNRLGDYYASRNAKKKE